MAIIKCPTCGKNHSDKMPGCPFCNTVHETSSHDEATVDTKPCPFCAEPIKRQAVLCRHCGSNLKPSSSGNQTSTWSGISAVLHVLPWAGSVLLFYWVANSPLFLANKNLGLVVSLVVLGSAVLMAIDASRIGFGSKPNPKTGKTEEGPTAWFLSALLLWLFAYPIYMFRRNRYGFASHAWVCLIGALVFAALTIRMGIFVDSELTRIQTQTQRAQEQALHEYEKAMRDLKALQNQHQ